MWADRQPAVPIKNLDPPDPRAAFLAGCHRAEGRAFSRAVMDDVRQFAKLYKDVASRTDLSAPAKLVHALIVDYVGENDAAWPGLRSLARSCGMNKATVSRAISDLEEAGLITVERPEGNPKGKTNKYRLADVRAARTSYAATRPRGAPVGRTRCAYEDVRAARTELTHTSGPDRRAAELAFATRISDALGLTPAQARSNRGPLVAVFRHVADHPNREEIVELMASEAASLANDGSVVNKAAAWQALVDSKTERNNGRGHH